MSKLRYAAEGKVLQEAPLNERWNLFAAVDFVFHNCVFDVREIIALEPLHALYIGISKH